ncbi:calcium/sodium antiporter [Agromyces archimandritae]|uniref:Calcium/sodium antiporter n=1 Tax=Agromyces archimandritae TaxID=2781962 RepID=A0A975IMF4_9MICO|nr:calcium/sodium antiporter [Agromyces archimandritae]QTX03428.1 calcium/sodium antiporter [Agromyces archimandritae]
MPAALAFVIGLVGVIVGAEFVARGGARFAAGLGIPPLIIGATIVAIGTSFPELAIGIEAALAGHADLAVANIAGTNTLNILLILGLVAVMRPLQLGPHTIRLDLGSIVIASLLLVVLCLDGELSVFDSFVLVAAGLVYLVVLVRAARRERSAVIAEAAGEYPEPKRDGKVGPILISALVLVAGLAIILLGADLLVDGAVGIASALGVSEAIIGLTIVAIGTSAPELATAIVSTLRGHRDIAVGNLIGSSVFNIVFILGITGLATPGSFEIPPEIVWIDLPVMLAAALVCVPIFLTGRNIVRRWEGALMMALYLGYLTTIVVLRT